MQSYCVLVSDTKSSETKKKLKFLKDHEDGFALAEYDLKMRGPGDAFGTNQSGIPFFKLADLYNDMDLLECAREISMDYVVDKALETQLDLFYYKLDSDIGL